MSIKIECVADTKSGIGEGAVWDVRTQSLWWVDIPAGLIHRFDPDTSQNQTWEWGEPVGCLALRENGGLVLATKTGFWLFDPESGERQHITNPEPDLPGNRFNDGTTDAQGRFWAGSMQDDGTPPKRQGTVYCLDTDLTVKPWRTGMFTPNGMAFSPDGSRMYLSDSYPEVRQIWSFDYNQQTGEPGVEQTFFDTRAVNGRPDGGTVDEDGCYWQAGVSGWQLYRLSPEGEVLATIDMPVEKPTKPMFGGANLDVLYVTSIGMGLTKGSNQPFAGGLFAVTGHGTRGVPQTRFAG